MTGKETVWQRAVRSLDTHKAARIQVLDVSRVTSIADYFVIASGGSANQVRALSDYLEQDLAKEGVRPIQSEGYRTGDWITLDYGDMLVHLFRHEVRDFYDLERLWIDAAVVDSTPYLIQELNDEEIEL